MEKIFLDIVNLSLTAGWMILAILLFRLILKKAPKDFFCTMWLMVGLRLAFPFSIESALSLIPSSQPLDTTVILESNKMSINTGVPAVDAPVNDYFAERYYEGVTVPAKHALNLTEIFTVIWLIGAAALFIYSVVSFLRLRMKLRTATILRDNIRESDFVKSPFVLGIFKPMIYIPYNMSENDRTNVLAHETAHIKRLDHIFKPLMFLICSVYWFNPLVWLAYSLFSKDIELACDESVIETLSKDERKSYSSALLTCSAKRRRIAPCPLAFGETSVKMRIKTVLRYKKPTFWVVVAAGVCVAVCGICFMTSPKTDEPAAIDLSGIDTMNIGAEIPNLKYGDKNKIIFEGGCGIVVFDFNQSRVTDRIPYEKIENLADFKMPVTAVTQDGKTIYFGEAESNASAPFGKYVYKYDIPSKRFTAIDPIDWENVEPFASSGLAPGFNKEYDRYLDLNYIISYDKIELGDSFVYLRAKPDWSMKSLQLVVYNYQSGESKVYDVWQTSNKADVYVLKSDSYFNDFSINGDEVSFECFVSLKNDSSEVKTVRLRADFAQDVESGLLKESPLYSSEPITIQPESAPYKLQVVFRGKNNGGKEKADRLLPEITVIEE